MAYYLVCNKSIILKIMRMKKENTHQDKTSPFPDLEQRILDFWKKQRIFERVNAQTDRPQFVFFEGPPTANAGPGLHHVIARVFKDVVCRYKTLQGYNVLRKAGWDTHGLPVELQIEKEIKTKTKADIEQFGIAAFNAKCKQSVWRFKQEWDKFTERIGYWLDLEHPYITYDASYMESLWWILKKAWDKGLLQQDYKVVPYCTRCGTVLSSHEVAQGYEDAQEESVYVKFKVADSKHPDTYFMVWTTTPWTLPGNVALAVHPDIAYVWLKQKNSGSTPLTTDGTTYIIAKDRIQVLQDEYEIIRESRGSDLVGMRYEPMFPYIKNANPKNIENAFQVLPASFATATEGTGIVHTAVMYGIDDYDLGKRYALPEYHTVDAQGNFISDVALWANQPAKKSDPAIRQWLKDNGVLYKTETITHTYPFCWRCHEPLLYYAHQSWFIRMSVLKDRLIQNNELIHWVPEHLKQGRFGEWLKDVKDWAISRERYWGTPLPIWVCDRNPTHKLAIGSLQDLSRNAYQPNTYVLIRHGESRSNVEKYLAPWPEKENMVSILTKKGIQEVRLLAESMRDTHIDMIISSDLARTRQTAEILHKQFPNAELLYDERLREINCGIYAYQPESEYDAFYHATKTESLDALFSKKPENGESLSDVQIRMLAVVREYDAKYHGKTIAIISHGDPLWLLESKLVTHSLSQTWQIDGFALAGMKKFTSPNFPYNDQGEVDLHRPFVDAVVCACPVCGALMHRVTDVIDCWFDSGAMPFAQFHFPFEQIELGQDPNMLVVSGAEPVVVSGAEPLVVSGAEPVAYAKLMGNKLPFPAQYISEAIDQTRGWFYTLLAISTLLDVGPAFLNVISMGHVMDEHGEKMSKSKGNIINPWKIFNTYGADALRWYFYTLNDPGEYKRFSEKDMKGRAHQDLMTILNVLKFWQTYAPQKVDMAKAQATEVMDQWMNARMALLSTTVKNHMDAYRVYEASRALQEFIDDLSRWYIRRSRRRFQKPENADELMNVSAFCARMMLDFVIMFSPFVPFLAEHIWQEIRRRLQDQNQIPESVHMASWPALMKSGAEPPENINGSAPILDHMKIIRALAERILALRAKAVIKVRQPLGVVEIAQKQALSEELCAILADEVNVKTIRFVNRISEKSSCVVDSQGDSAIGLDTEITEQLKQEGIVRELVRTVQEGRQAMGLLPQDTITLYYDALGAFAFLKQYVELLKKETKAREVIFEKHQVAYETEMADGKEKLWIGINK